MNEAQQILDDGLRMQESVLGEPTLIYRGRHIPCLFSALDRGTTLAVGGFDEDIQLTAIIRKSAHATRTADANEGWTADGDEPTADEDLMPPHSGKIVVANSRRYRILRVVEDSARGAWKVFLGSVNK